MSVRMPEPEEHDRELTRLRERVAELEQGSPGDPAPLPEVAFDSIADPTMVVGPDYHIVLANAAARKLAGGRDPVSEHLTCYQVSHHCDAPCHEDHLQCPVKLVFLTKTAITTTHIHYTEDGTARTVQVKAAPVCDRAGDVQWAVVSSRDVTVIESVRHSSPGP